MKHFKQVVLGGTCWAAGYLQKEDVLVIERSASIGGEYFDSYKQSFDWNLPLKSDLANKFRDEMKSRKMLNGVNTDFYGLLPIIYDYLKAYSHRVMLMTELAGIRKIDGKFELTVYNQSGQEFIYCEEIIDNSLYCVSNPDFGKENILEKSLNASAYVKSVNEVLYQNSENIKFRPGRNNNELFINYKIDRNATWVDARKALINKWISRSNDLKEARISAIAKEFEFSFKKISHQFEENWTYLNCCNFPNPLAAFDAGVNSIKNSSRKGANHVSC